jgi:predicted DNA-binding protein YlxM (UPF0122 family)
MRTENADDGASSCRMSQILDFFYSKLRKKCKNIFKGCNEHDKSESEITEANSK